ncbi:RNA polymerase-binding protein DksA [Halomonas eurihalina]|uniref:RNA polymerase-binding protein DksA n=1 Tax=Halomonas eurihalina TaxID=42566 RepID=A0A5D9D5L4_HALER|nr:TraR/DksA C4-type zinc finger protein [Halomonas eurihalina]MDR5859686.1 TraR/DksA C4-type zinc finger protein [Halomonas eurihalina]TZG39234.1 RNA polymerase-binding protein DksA [Halomonas eurihalina]
MPTSAEKAHLLAMPETDYMNGEQLDFFRRQLIEEKTAVERRLVELRHAMAVHEQNSDELDQAAYEEELGLQLRQADRETRLLANIAAALKRIDTGEFGYCEEMGEPIGLPRLLLRPTARLSLEAKERQEQHEHHYAKVRR